MALSTDSAPQHSEALCVCQHPSYLSSQGASIQDLKDLGGELYVPIDYRVEGGGRETMCRTPLKMSKTTLPVSD